MLNVYYGPMKEAIFNTAIYFKNRYEDSWIRSLRKRDDKGCG